MTQVLLKLLARLLVPDRCILCNVEGVGLCTGCRQDSLTLRTSSCYLCNAITSNGQVCTRCKSKTSIRRFLALWRLDENSEKVVYGVKYAGREDVAKAIAYQLAHSYLPDSDVITFVPDTPARRRARGFVSPQLIARELSLFTRVPVRALIKRRIHTPQVGAGRLTRWRQVKNNFKAINPGLVNGKKILLIDDVVTTGATLTECAQVLKQAGSAVIYAAAIAKK